MKILVTGDRNWTDILVIETAMSCRRSLLTCIVHGNARGADKISDKIARNWGIPVLPYPADWERYKKGAGPIRNRQMLKENPDIELVLAFHSDLSQSKGTRDMVNLAKKNNIPVEHWDGEKVHKWEPKVKGFFRI